MIDKLLRSYDNCILIDKDIYSNMKSIIKDCDMFFRGIDGNFYTKNRDEIGVIESKIKDLKKTGVI